LNASERIEVDLKIGVRVYGGKFSETAEPTAVVPPLGIVLESMMVETN